jgi:diguanylate cyclase
MRMLDALTVSNELADRHEHIKDQLGAELSDAELLEAFYASIDLTIEVCRKADHERQAWEVFVAQIGERLQELDKSLQSAEQQAMTTYYGGRKAEADLERQVSDIESRLYSASSIEQLRAYVHQRVAVVRARLEDAGGKSAQSFSAWQAQLNKMVDALRDLEHQSGELRHRYGYGSSELLVDPVTGLASRRAFEQRMQQEMARFLRYKSPVVLQFWQLDDFNTLRKTYGRPVCDRLLQLVAKILTTQLREVDFIAHYDPQMFGVLLPETQLKSAELVADRVCRTIAGAGFHYRGTQVSVTVSCGYTEFLPDDTDKNALERAHRALDQATTSGKGHYCAA